MYFLVIFVYFLLSPFLALAEKEQSSFEIKDILDNGMSIIEKVLHYRIIALENQSITLENIFIGLVALIIGFKAAKFLSRAIKRKIFSFLSLDSNSVSLIGRIIDYFLLFIIIVIVLDIAKVPITIFTFIGGALVVSIGLSSQHLINNFISGIVLIIESNLKVGDIIEYEDIIGRIEMIDSRCVRVRSQNNIEHFIPHSKLMQEKFSHWTSKNGGRLRVATNIKVEAKDVIRNDFEKIITVAVSQNRNILTIPKPQVLLLGFDNNILHYEINFWINLNSVDRRQIVSDINNRILNALKSYNIELAVPSVKHLK